MLRNYLARRKMRWAVRHVRDAHETTCPGETLTVERLCGALVWNRTTNHSSGFCFSRAALIHVSHWQMPP